MASVAFACSTCSKQFRVVPEQAGRKVRCPHCDAPNGIPSSVFAAVEATSTPSTSAPDVGDSLRDLAASVGSFAKSQRRDAPASTARTPLPLRYTHSRFARGMNIAAQCLFALAVFTLVIVLVAAPWDEPPSPRGNVMPFFAVLLAATIATGLSLIFLSHGLEYLARISEASEFISSRSQVTQGTPDRGSANDS